LSKKLTDTGGYQQDITVCQECRIRRSVILLDLIKPILISLTHRKTEWDTADIVIRHIDSNAAKNKPLVTYGRTNGKRQSQRIRQIKEGKRRNITVRKSTTVKGIKLMVRIEHGK
jgi:hypothetical protein